MVIVNLWTCGLHAADPLSNLLPISIYQLPYWAWKKRSTPEWTGDSSCLQTRHLDISGLSIRDRLADTEQQSVIIVWEPWLLADVLFPSAATFSPCFPPPTSLHSKGKKSEKLKKKGPLSLWLLNHQYLREPTHLHQWCQLTATWPSTRLTLTHSSGLIEDTPLMTDTGRLEPRS